jgi:predicted permease
MASGAAHVGWHSVAALCADIRTAARGLRRTPGFTLGATIVLGVGIGVNTAVFTIANATLFKGFSGPSHQDRLVYLTTGRDCCISYLDLSDWRAGATTIAGIAAVADLRVAFDTGRGPETVTATEITANTFALLGVDPSLGRDFTASDDVPGAPGVAILSHAFWHQRFDDDPTVLGRIVRINGTPTSVVGVMPPDFVFPQHQELWLPLGPRAAGQPRNGRGLWFGVGRLAEGATIADARAELSLIGERLAATYPDTNARVRPVVQTFREFFVGPNALAVYGSLWGAVGLLLAIACANLVSLLLARTTGRMRELGVRLALGAGRGRIVGQQLFESAMLSAGGGVVGWWFGTLIVRAYTSVATPPTQPWASQLFDYSIDARVVAYLAGLSIVAGVAVGVLPALRASSIDVSSSLRDGGRGTIGRRERARVTNAIVTGQVALAVVLLSAAGVLVRSFLTIEGRDIGYDSSHVLVALASLPAETYPDARSQFAFFDRIATGVGAIPGVNAVGFVDGLAGQSGGRTTIEIEGQPLTAADSGQTRTLSISGGYFAALGRSIAAGRDFDDRDTIDGPQVVVVNRRFAQLHWQVESVLGRRLRVNTGLSPGPWLEVVGVAPDVNYGDRTRNEIEPAVYRPLRQRPARGTWVLARTSVAPRSLIDAMRRQIQAVDPSLPVWLGPYALDDWHAGVYWRRGIQGGLFVVFAALALLLASVGLFAVVAGSVAQRRQEIGVRMAIGATTGAIRRLVIRQGLAPALIGLALGLVVSLGTNRLLASELVEVAPSDPSTLLGVAAVIIVTALAGCLLPALRASRIDPLIAIRLD